MRFPAHCTLGRHHPHRTRPQSCSIALESQINPDSRMPKKNPAAVALGRLGGKKGGPARAARMTQAERAECARKGGAARMSKLTPEQRSEAARKAVQARWKKVKKLYLNAYLEALEEGAA